MSEPIKCPSCDGEGEIIWDDSIGRNEELCDKCGGSGEIENVECVKETP